jgi:hypothetical protein
MSYQRGVVNADGQMVDMGRAMRSAHAVLITSETLQLLSLDQRKRVSLGSVRVGYVASALRIGP